MPFESWIRHITEFLILTPPWNKKHVNILDSFHVCTPLLWLSGVLIILYSKCCGMVIWKLNCLYRCWWNGVLHCGHLFFPTIKVIMHYGLYMCWQVPNCHVLSNPKGEQCMKHWFPFCMKAWSVGHKNSHVFFEPTMRYSQSNLGSISQSTLLISYRFSKLSKNILNILGPDVKPCDWNISSSQCSLWIHISFISIYVIRNAPKIHASYILFEFYKLTFANVSTSFQWCSLMSIKFCW
jgi:hypothetical protein